MYVIITYDIKRNHTDIKTELKSLGYRDTIAGTVRGTSTPINKRLPNTTLIKYGASSTANVSDQVSGVIDKHNGGLDQLFCAQLAEDFNWNGQ